MSFFSPLLDSLQLNYSIVLIRNNLSSSSSSSVVNKTSPSRFNDWNISEQRRMERHVVGQRSMIQDRPTSTENV